MYKKLVVAAAAGSLAMAAAAIDLTDEQREAIARRLQPVGSVCLKGDSGCAAKVQVPPASAATAAADTATAQAGGGRSGTATADAAADDDRTAAAGAAAGGASGSETSDSAAAGADEAATAAAGGEADEGAAADGGGEMTVAAAAIDGEAIYNQACMACHTTGAGGAPMIGNVDQWSDRIAKGRDALHQSGLNGVAGTAMMAKGGRVDLSDAQVVAAVDYMIAQSQ